MAGIKWASASLVMADGDTAVDKSISDLVVGEQATLRTSPAGTTYAWSLSIPSASASARSALDDDEAVAPKFTPDAAGTYTITVDVDGTSYSLRATVASVTIAEYAQALRMAPVADATIPAPSQGMTLYYSSTQSTLCVKKPDGTVHEVDLTPA
jgi:hypothetical protein